ncbi:hypothetical protein IWX78_003099 [Mycetocola sp. CAN_C7]
MPANDAAGTVTFPVPPIADSRSHTNVFETAPIPAISCHMPARMSPACREGIITAVSIFENVNVITNTGSINDCPCPTGIFGSGNHRSHCVAAPGSCTIRSAGSTPAYSGRIWRMRSFKVVIECSQPMRSAMTVAGIRGKSRSSLRTSPSTASTNDPFDEREYPGGSSDASAARTVLRATPTGARSP